MSPGDGTAPFLLLSESELPMSIETPAFARFNTRDDRDHDPPLHGAKPDILRRLQPLDFVS